MYGMLAGGAALALTCIASSASAQTLQVGDQAPPLMVESWIKGGEGVEGIEPGKVYVVEFWATWCPPCLTSIPHLTKLQSDFKRRHVSIIGVTRPDPQNTWDVVESFVKEQGDAMAYHLAWDESGSIYQSYMVDAEQQGIPKAFVVDRQGRLVWIGNPLGGLDWTLEKVTDEAWSFERFEQGQMILNRAHGSFQDGDFAMAHVFTDELIAEYPSLFGAEAHHLKLWIHWNKGEQDKVLAQFDTLILEYPRFRSDDTIFEKFSTLMEYARVEESMKLGRELMEGRFKENPDRLALMAWGIATIGVEGLDLDLALEAATRANELRKGEHADTIDTLAKVHFERGEFKRALELQERAVDIETDPAKLHYFEITLQEYREATRD